eukprot:790005_1
MEIPFDKYIMDMNQKLLDSKQNIKVDAELNKLENKLLSKFAETKEIQVDAEMVKKLSGGDSMAPRDSHGRGRNTKKLQTKHVMWCLTQAVPDFSCGDGAFKRRQIAVPSERYFRHENEE